jgi:hypothetical protein
MIPHITHLTFQRELVAERRMSSARVVHRSSASRDSIKTTGFKPGDRTTRESLLRCGQVAAHEAAAVVALAALLARKPEVRAAREAPRASAAASPWHLSARREML